MKNKKNFEWDLDIERPANLDGYTLIQWFEDKIYNLDDNELIYENIHIGNRLRRVRLKSNLLRAFRDEIGKPRYSVHNSLDNNHLTDYKKKYINFDHRDDVLKNIQPPHIRIVYEKDKG